MEKFTRNSDMKKVRQELHFYITTLTCLWKFSAYRRETLHLLRQLAVAQQNSEDFHLHWQFTSLKATHTLAFARKPRHAQYSRPVHLFRELWLQYLELWELNFFFLILAFFSYPCAFASHVGTSFLLDSGGGGGVISGR